MTDQYKIRLVGCKGSFQTCEICNNAHELLRNRSKNFTQYERDIIMQFQGIHLKQQANERLTCEENKLRAKELNAEGQPLFAQLGAG